MTYLHRTQATANAIEVLNPLQLHIMSAKSPKLPKILTVSWALGCLDAERLVARYRLFSRLYHVRLITY
ncbi:hypothetical protein [Nostoc sp.]|uniref:hypothetical protein n=1 Tax=Nostoc sp. TaxID=1180 RepID=UPI002FFCBF81